MRKMSGFDHWLFGKYLEKGEHVIGVIHKHWWSYIMRILGIVMLSGVVPVALGILFPEVIEYVIGIGLVVFCFQMYHIADDYLDVWIITNTSVIDLEWNGIFDHLAKRIDLIDIQDSTILRQGILAHVLGYGNVRLKVASGQEIEIEMVPNPEMMRQQIHATQKRRSSLASDAERQQAHELMRSLLEDHLERRGG